MILARSQGCQTHCGGRAQGDWCVGLDDGSKCSPSLASPSTAEDSLHYKDLSTHISNIRLDAAQYACSLPGGSRPFVGRIPQRACSMLPLRLPSGVWGADKTSFLKTNSTPSYWAMLGKSHGTTCSTCLCTGPHGVNEADTEQEVSPAPPSGNECGWEQQTGDFPLHHWQKPCLTVLCFPLWTRSLWNCPLSQGSGSGQMQLAPGTNLDGRSEMTDVLGQTVMFACVMTADGLLGTSAELIQSPRTLAGLPATETVLT